MKFTDRVIDGANEKRREAQKKRKINYYDDLNGTEMGYAYDNPPKSITLNTDKSIYDKADDTSINTMKSIFDKTAVFHVDPNN